MTETQQPGPPETLIEKLNAIVAQAEAGITTAQHFRPFGLQCVILLRALIDLNIRANGPAGLIAALQLLADGLGEDNQEETAFFSLLLRTVATIEPVIKELSLSGAKITILDYTMTLLHHIRADFAPHSALEETDCQAIQWLDIHRVVQLLNLVSLECMRERIRPWMDLAAIDELLENQMLPLDILDVMTEREREAFSAHRNLRPGYTSWKRMITEVSHRAEREIDRNSQFIHRQMRADVQQRGKVLGNAMHRISTQVKREAVPTEQELLIKALERLLDEKGEQQLSHESMPAPAHRGPRRKIIVPDTYPPSAVSDEGNEPQYSLTDEYDGITIKAREAEEAEVFEEKGEEEVALEETSDEEIFAEIEKENERKRMLAKLASAGNEEARKEYHQLTMVSHKKEGYPI